jgi:hypothetical protein
MPYRRIRALALPFWAGLAIAALPHRATAQTPAAVLPPAATTLDEISARGRALAGYERAAWRAYAQLLATKPDPRFTQRYIAYRADSGWAVAFGRLNTSRDTFYVSHVAIPALVDGKRADTLFSIQAMETPGADTDYLVRAARAIDTATALFWPTNRPYDAAVLPSADGSWWVYVVPAPNREGVWPLGDDMRYRISADGRSVLEARRMHIGTVEFDRTKRPPETRLVAGVHNTMVSDAPEDSDVFHVLTRTPRVFEYVFTPRFLYMINEDGSIRFVLGRAGVVGSSQ